MGEKPAVSATDHGVAIHVPLGASWPDVLRAASDAYRFSKRARPRVPTSKQSAQQARDFEAWARHVGFDGRPPMGYRQLVRHMRERGYALPDDPEAAKAEVRRWASRWAYESTEQV